MKINIAAVSLNDGWAFIIENEKLFLLRPPYLSSNHIEVSEKDMENAMQIQGFEKLDINFNDIKEVIRFLKEKYIEYRKNQGVGIPSSKQLKELLKYAPDDILLEYLNRTKNVLIPGGKIDAAESIAMELMKLTKIKNDNKMLEMTINILEECRKIKQEKERLAMKISENRKETLEGRFPNAVYKYSALSISKLQKGVADRKLLLPLCT